MDVSNESDIASPQEAQPPHQKWLTSRRLKLLLWLAGGGIISFVLFLGCSFLSISAGIVTNFLSGPPYVEPAIPMRLAFIITLASFVGLGTSISASAISIVILAVTYAHDSLLSKS